MHPDRSPFLSPAATVQLSALESLWGAPAYRPTSPVCESARAALEPLLGRFPAALCPGCSAPAADCWAGVPS